MKDRSILPMISGNDAEDTFHRAIHRINSDSTIPKGKRTLGTKYSEASPSEPTETTRWYPDELADSQQDVMKARTVFMAIILLAIIAPAVLGLIALIVRN